MRGYTSCNNRELIHTYYITCTYLYSNQFYINCTVTVITLRLYNFLLENNNDYVIKLQKKLEGKSVTSDSSGKCDIAREDSDALSVDGTQVGVFKKSNKERFCCFMKGPKGCRLKHQSFQMELLSDFTNQSLKPDLWNQQLCRFLQPSDLLQRKHARPIPKLSLLDFELSMASFLGRFSLPFPTLGFQHLICPCWSDRRFLRGLFLDTSHFV